MKIHRKEKFHFLSPGGRHVEAKDGEVYFREELRFKKKFPFIFIEWVVYKLDGNYWVEKSNV